MYWIHKFFCPPLMVNQSTAGCAYKLQFDGTSNIVDGHLNLAIDLQSSPRFVGKGVATVAEAKAAGA
jgi:hypothetical protein